MSENKTRTISHGARYYYILSSDFQLGSATWFGNDFQLAKLESGNIFLTKEEAEAKLSKILKILKEDWE